MNGARSRTHEIDSFIAQRLALADLLLAMLFLESNEANFYRTIFWDKHMANLKLNGNKALPPMSYLAYFLYILVDGEMRVSM